MQWRLREKGFFKARAIREVPVSTAIKAIATLNERVSSVDVVLEADVSFAKFDGDPGGRQKAPTVIEMLVKESDEEVPRNLPEFKVSAKDTSEAGIVKLSKAISMACGSGRGVRLRCMGAGSIFKAIMACIIAKGQMFSSGKTSRLVPQWLTIIEDEKPISSILIDFWCSSV
jgi:stage V sporulation protein SpoVS